MLTDIFNYSFHKCIFWREWFQSCEKIELVVARRRLSKEKEVSSSSSDASPCRTWQIECTPDRNMNTTKIVYHQDGFRSSSCEALIEESHLRTGNTELMPTTTGRGSGSKRWSLDNAEDIALMRYYHRNNNKQLESVLLQQKTVTICKVRVRQIFSIFSRFLFQNLLEILLNYEFLFFAEISMLIFSDYFLD